MSTSDSGTASSDLVVSYPVKKVALIRLNRPQVLNALTGDLLTRLGNEIERIGREPNVRAIVLTGTGRAFSAGGDVRALTKMNEAECREYLSCYVAVHRAIRDCEVPVIAALNGYTLGGGVELACMADVRVVDPEATLCVADAAIGMVPTGGLTWALPRLVGHGRARMWTLWNTHLSAADAATAGLCEVMSDAGASVDKAVALGEELGELPRHGLTSIRRAFALAEDLDSAARTEVDENLACIKHPETQAALAAFLAR
ncbi:enoyl-CoA hydratase/isomerase family protein [Rhodococcus pyridinivorans]|uniref:enoyl-CoA hydratase/isomerase family protein n=1 Tax=Rhodococcus pyridinivorans TaxID=103816 RepID=UPI001E3498A5|nr:enoyl-CoA hydratase/isomerase family protein [Rhodococcus pyridinivorans]MCD5422892.1 enoyl-CoA hydratase/isomerase family protein [Rhodococcus pyridinivorans]